MPDKITKFINSLNAKTKKRLKEKLIAIKKDPYHAGDVKKLKAGSSDIYRLRMGKIRILYQVTKDQGEVIDIDYRGNIY